MPRTTHQMTCLRRSNSAVSQTGHQKSDPRQKSVDEILVRISLPQARVFQKNLAPCEMMVDACACHVPRDFFAVLEVEG